jgi:hypothetical protein
VKADVKVDSIDFAALKLYNGELRAKGLLHADIPELNPDYPRGSIKCWQPVVVIDGKRYFMDSVYAISKPDPDTGQNIAVNLQVMDAHITGHTPLTKIGAIVQDHIDRHYSSSVSDSLKIDIAKLTKKKNGPGKTSRLLTPKPAPVRNTAIPADYNLNFVAHVYDKPLLHSLVPGLTSFDSIHVDGSLTPRNLTFNANTTEVIYNALTVENAAIKLRGSDSALAYSFNVDKITQSDFSLYFADIHGALDNSILTTSISLSDQNRTERFALKGSLQTVRDSQIIHLDTGLKLNYNVWQVSQPNKVVIAKKGFYVQNLGLRNKDQLLTANSDRPVPGVPVKVNISNFALSNITELMVKNDTLIADGLLSGNIVIEQFTPKTKMTGDLQVQDLVVYNDTVGNLKMKIDNKTDDLLDTRIAIDGRGNDILLTGYYDLKPNSTNVFNFNIAVNALAVQTFEGFTMHSIKNSSGYLRGNLKVQGTFDNPNITGEIRTDNLVTTPTYVNTRFRMPSEKITFTGKEMTFNSFNLLDSAGNKANIDGTIGYSDLTDPDLNLVLTADNWKAVHSTARENKELYGDLIISTKLNVSGSVSTPVVDGNLRILDGTKLTVANPQKNVELQSTKGIVVFVNMRDTTWGKQLMPRMKDTATRKKKLAAGSDINVNITVEKKAQFSLIIDEASGDFINLRGDAYFNTSVSAGGVFEVTGTYQLHSGEYQMNYNFIRRKFIIQDGSTITIAGDPMKGTMLDIKAIYQANTPAYDLVMRQVPDPAQLNYYKQSLPFDIDLNIRGNMMQPAFSFDVVLPDNKVYPLTADQIALVQAKLAQVRQDTSELNKQVFAVLILGRFVSDDPFSSGTAQGLGFTAIQSVSTFIGEELNKAANKLVKGVDLSVDLATTQDYTTGDMRQRTDLNVAASKRILNDRLKLTVGNDFEVEGPQANNGAQSGVPSNLAADYLLSGDGRYTVRIYRRNYDEGVLQGYVTETGVNFIASVDYNRFKTIFMRSKKRKQLAKGNNK